MKQLRRVELYRATTMSSYIIEGIFVDQTQHFINFNRERVKLFYFIQEE